MFQRVSQKYVLHNRIGHGSFGQLYSGEDTLSREKVAVKLEHFETRPRRLQDDQKICKVLNGSVGIPNMKWYGVEYNVMVIELLEQKIEGLFADCTYPFSLKTVLMVVNQILARI